VQVLCCTLLHSRLRAVFLNLNQISDEGAKHIDAMLSAQQSSLRMVVLRSNLISEQMSKELHVKHSRTLGLDWVRETGINGSQLWKVSDLPEGSDTYLF